MFLEISERAHVFFTICAPLLVVCSKKVSLSKFYFVLFICNFYQYPTGEYMNIILHNILERFLVFCYIFTDSVICVALQGSLDWHV